MLKVLATTILAGLLVWSAFASEPTAPGPTSAVKDGFPTGTDTPEGAACDLARAFIRNDAALFLAACLEPCGSPEERTAYHKFLEGVVVQMKSDAGSSPVSPQSPQSIIKCFAARHLSNAGAAVYGAAAFGFQDVMFVDVSARLQNGSPQLCRTLVVRNKQGRWLVDPLPDLLPPLSAGLDDEPPSKQDFSERLPAK